MLSLQDVENRAKSIRMLVLDVDGVLTDGRLFYGTANSEIKCFNTLDGHGLKLLQQSGVSIAIITGRKSEQVQRRANDLGIQHIIQGREDKFVALQEILSAHPIPLENIAFMGDDWPDLTVMCRVGLALTVPNAHQAVKDYSHWQSEKSGGEGAAREACDLIMKSQNTYNSMLAPYITPKPDNT